MAFLYFLLFLVLAALSAVLFLGWRAMRLFAGMGKPKKAAVAEREPDDEERLRHIRAEFKRRGEYVDYEEVRGADGGFEK